MDEIKQNVQENTLVESKIHEFKAAVAGLSQGCKSYNTTGPSPLQLQPPVLYCTKSFGILVNLVY